MFKHNAINSNRINMEQIVKNFLKKDYNSVSDALAMQSHKNYIKITFQMSYIDFVQTKNKIYMKLFKMINNKPKFYTYGYLDKNNFSIDRSNVNVFSYNNLNKRIFRRKDNNCYIIVVGDNANYLLYSPYSNMIDSMFKKIKTN